MSNIREEAIRTYNQLPYEKKPMYWHLWKRAFDLGAAFMRNICRNQQLNKPVLVLDTSGENDDVKFVKVKVFDTKQRAEMYCKGVTDDIKDKVHWRSAEVVKDGALYELLRYKLY